MSGRMVSQKRQYDRNVRLTEYQPGDVVLLNRPVTKRGKSPKLSRHWTGPFLIQDRINQVNYRIQASPRSKAHVVHADRLKLCHGTHPDALRFPGSGEPPYGGRSGVTGDAHHSPSPRGRVRGGNRFRIRLVGVRCGSDAGSCHEDSVGPRRTSTAAPRLPVLLIDYRRSTACWGSGGSGRPPDPLPWFEASGRTD